MSKKKKVNIPGNFGYGDMPGDYRMKFKQLLEKTQKDKDEKAKNKVAEEEEKERKRKEKTLYNNSNMN